MNLYVGNLNFGITENELRDLFNRYGKITAVTIIRDRYTNRSKGFGFVVMSNPLEAGQAIKQLDGTPLRERNIKVSWARPPKNRSMRPPSGYSLRDN